MKHCMYCDALMANDAIFCPKCGRKQQKSNNYVANNVSNDININVQPPITLSHKLKRDLYPNTINEYRKKIGFKHNTTNLVYVTLGSNALRMAIGGSLLGIVGDIAGEASVDKFIMSIEKTGILLLGLNSVNLRFNGRNRFIPNKKITRAEIIGNIIEFKINDNYFDIKCPLILFGIGTYRKHVFDLINKRFNRNDDIHVNENKQTQHVTQSEYNNQLRQDKNDKWKTFFGVIIFFVVLILLIGIGLITGDING